MSSTIRGFRNVKEKDDNRHAFVYRGSDKIKVNGVTGGIGSLAEEAILGCADGQKAGKLLHEVPLSNSFEYYRAD